MNKKHFIVDFYNGFSVFVNAFHIDEAVILAQAKMIENGYTYDVEDIRETRYISDAKLVNFVA